MSICNNCNLKEICKTYDYIININHANISINNCNFYTNTVINNSTNNINNTNIKDIPNKLIIGETKPRKDLRAIEKKINHVKEKEKPKLITCPSCNGTTYDDDLKICVQCGKTVCSNCGTVDNGNIYCEECWNNK